MAQVIESRGAIAHGYAANPETHRFVTAISKAAVAGGVELAIPTLQDIRRITDPGSGKEIEYRVVPSLRRQAERLMSGIRQVHKERPLTVIGSHSQGSSVLALAIKQGLDIGQIEKASFAAPFVDLSNEKVLARLEATFQERIPTYEEEKMAEEYGGVAGITASWNEGGPIVGLVAQEYFEELADPTTPTPLSTFVCMVRKLAYYGKAFPRIVAYRAAEDDRFKDQTEEYEALEAAFAGVPGVSLETVDGAKHNFPRMEAEVAAQIFPPLNGLVALDPAS